jgi:hypothetical protein
MVPILPKTGDLLVVAISVSLQCGSLGTFETPATGLILDVVEGTAGAEFDGRWISHDFQSSLQLHA